MMRVTTIGTGTAAPSPARVQSATLVETAGVRLLVDCGSGAVYRMAQLGVDWRSITHVALTHFHADHTNDLANLIYAWRYGTLPPRSEPVTIVGPVGTDALLTHLADAFGHGVRDAVPLVVHEIAAGGSLDLGGTLIEALKVPHTDESLAFAVRNGAIRVVLSGDTGFSPELGAWAAGCALFLLECSLPDAFAIASHLTPRQCGALGAIARPGVLVLNHFYPPVESTGIEAQVREGYDGPLVLATDGWSILLQEP